MQLRRILFNQAPEGIGLYPLYSTEKPVREWPRAVREALYKATKLEILKGGQKQTSEDKEKTKQLLDYIHQGYGSATFDLNDPKLRRLLESPASPMLLTIPDREHPVLTASTNQETLEMLAEKDPLCEKLNDCRSIATLANNYCRKDGSWGQSRVKQFLESIEAEEEDDSQILLFEMEATPVQKAAAETVKKRQKALSMAVNRDASILYTTYWGSLETHRLRTSPNVSAVPKGEADYVSKIIGEAPPHSIRGMEMAPYGWFMAELDYTGGRGSAPGPSIRRPKHDADHGRSHARPARLARAREGPRAAREVHRRRDQEEIQITAGRSQALHLRNPLPARQRGHGPKPEPRGRPRQEAGQPHGRERGAHQERLCAPLQHGLGAIWKGK